ncbi:succinate-semialdehyde dehydrogenase/glutarate-semialdehyde dehydrogenase [Rhizobium leguminosarum]|uniref:Succinate-semialdehyde dehydrogenase/glutarate-semialdehyde dehydrogenase n=1 Tax=Rhizobium leguminosarum TaxID=384 RepID=A0AAE2MPW8_RHILE|nr:MULTISPECIES: NAD-dependent succinate-semialdehyde dehydrogenase [Rhizobium]MBB4293327.1 succinate-semialdehyde dehydrogenase/glutarate-semialdehyde dehydrogenase [Rhizobium leguminosarum]MBB4296062.1 succinate-semialdehyde dehydrogenase/glutarate-semialdehyde dehydrogenase [Rhizobium leguminosarum]MBB4311411.1 succinate-semialdehyde dehydrogenase/glutarate-semialdehyde dehydrogenase [Rhizobium leguminosarum]MBB4420287.1 succinate-semialdehyde dehydrogenase/glutarate-semialdehyde dehydrogena
MTFTTALTRHVTFSSPLLRDAGYINGVWTSGDAEKTFDVLNPATGELLGSLPDMGASETRTAIDAAHAAQPAWAARPAKERSATLRKWFDLMVANADELAAILTAEMGKPFPEARGEILYAAAYIEWYAEEAKRIYGETIPAPSQDRRMIVIKQPVGVVGTITPWNFPAAMIARKVAPALAVGCTVVSKPAEQTPLTAIALAVLAEQAGIPPGVFNVIVGTDGPAIGRELCGNEKVRKISFTGSTEVGRILMRQCADQIKKVSLELGGNAPFIVFDDADLDAAVEGAIASKYRNAGQTCVCANRLYVQSNVYDAFAAKLAAKVAAMSVGDGFMAGVEIGPLIDEQGLAKVEDHVSDALAKGAKVLTGGKRIDGAGTFFTPTVLTGVARGMKVAREETFGPVAPLFRFETVEDVIAQANDTEFGLAAYFYASDLKKVWRVAEALEYGMIGINTGLMSSETAPFGGIKQSGLGREGSRHGADDYLEMKYLCIGGV